MRVLAVGIIIGTVIGGYALSRIPGQYLGIFFGVLLLLVVVISLGGIRLKYSSTNMFSMGAAAGFMGITVASGSPLSRLFINMNRDQRCGPHSRSSIYSVVY